jgi:hypothetical protein
MLIDRDRVRNDTSGSRAGRTRLGRADMRHRVAGAIVLGLGFAALAAAEPIWDNYLSPEPGYDRVSFFTSEADATVTDSWVADDFSFTHPVTLTGLDWLGARKTRYTYTAEVLIMDSTFAVVDGGALTGLPYAETPISDPDFVIGFQLYEGTVELPEVTLPAGRYYVGVRLRSERDGQPGGGRNFWLTTGSGELNGVTEAAFRAEDWGYADWTMMSDIDPPLVSDFAFRLYGVPEPATAMLILAGIAVLRRR